MVGHKIGGYQRIDALWVSTHPRNGRSHRRKVNDGRNPSEVLEDHGDGRRGNSFTTDGFGSHPAREAYVFLGVDVSVESTKKALQQDLLA